MSYRHRSLVLIIWGLDSTMFEIVVAGWVAIISISHYLVIPFLIHSPLLAHWASHVHYSLSFLSPCSHFFTPGLGPFSICMHCLEASWALDLQVHLSLIIFFYHRTTTFLHIPLVVFFISHYLFYLLVLLHILSTLSGDPHQLITWRIVISFSLSIPRTLIQRSLVWEGHLVMESFGLP